MMRFIQGPPVSVFAQRRRILTEVQNAVNSAASLLLALLLVTLVVPPAGARAVPTAGDLRLLVVLAGFPDRPLAHDRPYFTGTPTSLVDRLVAYWAEVSGGRLRIVPTVGQAIVTLPAPRPRYVQRPDAMARDAFTGFAHAATDPADVAALDADALVVFFAGDGRESHVQGGDPNDPWSNFTNLFPPVRVGTHAFDQACVIAESEVAPFTPFGVLCHEFGHQLGLPELYAPGGLPQEGIGVWGLMGQGTWLRRGAKPPHPCAWSKVRLGWAEVETIDASRRGVILPAVETEARVVKIAAVPARPYEYYLLENRTRQGADEALPGEGMLVWHVDERVGGFRSGQVDPTHKLLHLVEADGRGDLDRGHAAGGNRGDASDPWFGPPRWRRTSAAALLGIGALLVATALLRSARARPLVPVLARLAIAAVLFFLARTLHQSPVCGPATPGMAPYGGEPGRVILRNFSAPGPRMTVDVFVAPASAPVAAD
jgi:M6 family metalloprotease-like protein